MNNPGDIGSTEQKHFNAAYRGRPFLNVTVTILYILIILFGIGGIVEIIIGELFMGLGLVVFAGVAFAFWAIFHNWALSNPKDGDTSEV